jgi:hypothetical protein
LKSKSVILTGHFREKEDEEARKNKKQRVAKDESGTLWVDKYRPKTYIDLMGDQRLNRNVLRWVKQWDFCVFKKKRSEESQRDKVMRQYKSTFGTNPRFEAYKKSTVAVSLRLFLTLKKCVC